MNLSDKVALVTGGGRRVGRAVALALADGGCDVAITCRRSADAARRVAEMVRQRERRAWIFEADLADPRCIEPLRDRLLDATGGLDVLVNNASVFEPTAWGEVTEQAWSRQMTINALSPMLLTQAMADALGAGEGGRVVNFVDIHVMGRPRPGYVAYNASKAALAEVTASLAIEMAPAVTVNAIAPGVVAWAESMTEEEKRAYLHRVPLARPGTVEDAARAVVYLARDADYVTGQIIRLDGGRWLT